jgi:hypothetical protein
MCTPRLQNLCNLHAPILWNRVWLCMRVVIEYQEVTHIKGIRILTILMAKKSLKVDHN